MEFAKYDCFGGPTFLGEHLVYIFLTVAVALFAWKVLHPPRLSTW
jgi:hypothetical protein